MNQITVLNKINDLGYQGLKEAYHRQIEDVNYIVNPEKLKIII